MVNSADALTVLKMSIGLHNVSAGETYSYDSDLDFDGDQVVNGYDLTHLAADVNGDGKVNSRDALEILKIAFAWMMRLNQAGCLQKVPLIQFKILSPIKALFVAMLTILE